MALKAVDNTKNLVWGPTGDNVAGQPGLAGVISKTTQRSFQSETEVVGGDGELVDIIYTGAEETITETKYGKVTDFTADHNTIGTGDYKNDGIVVKTTIQLSNEDASKIIIEKLKQIP